MEGIPKIILEERSTETRAGETSSPLRRNRPASSPPCKGHGAGAEYSGCSTLPANASGHNDAEGQGNKEDEINERPRDLHGAMGHMPIRSSSDIGLPATSLPDLALSLMSGGSGTGDTHLGVYCSPRASRRSVDLEVLGSQSMQARVGSGGQRSQYHAQDWHSHYADFQTGASSNSSVADATNNIIIFDTSINNSSNNIINANNPCTGGNSLRVLTASSRAASALSLTSDCTARSIGLLSNDGDSDSEADASLMSDTVTGGQGQSYLQLSGKPGGGGGSGAAQLRRYMSHPEESAGVSGSGAEVGHARPSVSLCNIKCAETNMLTNPVDNTKKEVSSQILQSSTTEIENSAPCKYIDDPHEEIVSSSSHNPSPIPQDTVGRNGKGEQKTSSTDNSSIAGPKQLTMSSTPPKGGEFEDTIPQSLKDGSLHRRTRKSDIETRPTFSCGGSQIVTGSEKRAQRMLSYRSDSGDMTRNGRVRQWLQDMDKLDLSND